jgi:hypothetical protein
MGAEEAWTTGIWHRLRIATLEVPLDKEVSHAMSSCIRTVKAKSRAVPRKDGIPPVSQRTPMAGDVAKDYNHLQKV